MRLINSAFIITGLTLATPLRAAGSDHAGTAKAGAVIPRSSHEETGPSSKDPDAIPEACHVPPVIEADGFRRLSEGSGGPAGLQEKVMTDSQGLSGEVRISAPQSSADGAPTGLMVYLHGDGAYDHDEQWLDVVATAKRHNLIAVAVKSPVVAGDSGLTPSWWQNAEKKGFFFDHVLRSLEKTYNIDRGRTVFSGASGGSTFLAGHFVPQLAQRFRGGLVSMCGGYLNSLSQPRVTRDMTKHFGVRIVNGGEDFLLNYQNAGAEATYQIYDRMGFDAKREIQPGYGHCYFDKPMFSIINDKVKDIFAEQGDKCSLPDDSPLAKKMEEYLLNRPFARSFGRPGGEAFDRASTPRGSSFLKGVPQLPRLKPKNPRALVQNQASERNAKLDELETDLNSGKVSPEEVIKKGDGLAKTWSTRVAELKSKEKVFEAWKEKSEERKKARAEAKRNAEEKEKSEISSGKADGKNGGALERGERKPRPKAESTSLVEDESEEALPPDLTEQEKVELADLEAKLARWKALREKALKKRDEEALKKKAETDKLREEAIELAKRAAKAMSAPAKP